MEYSNLLRIISKIRNILYYYWFFIAHRSPNYRSPLSARMVVTSSLRRSNDDSESDPLLKFGATWSFKDPDSLEAWSMEMIPFTHDMCFTFKFRRSQVFISFTKAERVKEVDHLADDIIQVKCMTGGVLINPADEYHFTIMLPSKAIPFTLAHLLESLLPIEYVGEIKELENKAKDFIDSNNMLIVEKQLCSKVKSLLRDFAVIKAKLDAQRALASSRFVGNSPQRRLGRSQRSVDIAEGPLSTSRGKAKPRPSSACRGQQRPSKLNPAANRRVLVGTSEGSGVDHPSLKEAMMTSPPLTTRGPRRTLSTSRLCTRSSGQIARTPTYLA